MRARQPAFSRSSVALAAAALMGTLVTTPASAATCTWNTTNGNWNALVNWLNCPAGNGNPGGVPGGADTAVIGAGGTVTVSTAQAILALNNAGVVNVNNAVALSLDARSSGASFIGGGQVVLGGSGSRLYVEGANGVTVGAGSTIRGAGQIGQAVLQSGASLFSHAGTISADSNGESLILLNPGNSGSYANNGLMEARNGGTLDLRSTFTQTGSGQMRAEAGSTVLLNGSGIFGGVVGSSGSGRIRASNDFSNVLSNVTLAGVVDLASATSQLRIVDGLSFNNGGIDIGGSVLYLDNRNIATQSLGGTGSIGLAGGALRMEGTGQTTTGANVTIRGYGTVGQATSQSGQYTWINNGLVSADVNGQTLNLVNPANGSQPIQNNGILEAINGGRLLLSADVTAAPGSQMRAGTGSVIEMNGVRVTGTVNTTGTGSFRASSNFANNLSGVTLNGNMDLASQFSQLRISDGLVLNGGIDIGGSVVYLDNRTTGTQAVSGTGSFNLAGGALRMEGTGQTTTGTNITIRGHGTVGQASSQSGQYLWTNNGLVSADVSGQTLNLVNPANGSLPIQNNGTLRATGGGTLQISANVTNGAGSSYNVDAGSVILMNGVTLTGIVNQTGTGAIDVNSSFANALTASTLSGRVNVGTGGGSQLRLTDGMTMNAGATINVGGSGVVYFDNRSTPTQALSGSGQFVLNGGTLRFEGGSSTTWGSGITVRGSGNIGQATSQSANQTLFNNGTIIADGGNLNIAAIANGGALQGTGTLRVEGGNLSLGTGQTTNQGTLDLRATGTLALGTQNLVLSSDYTNAQAGTGNAFNRRAGVTGTGQILAGGDAAQALTGANITNGNTNNATLTIGNVRVGANTFNYQIGNGGTTGPTLRGAIQTNVNGGNITDARLSGAGVTAANYSAGAPGANSGNLGITFTAASAGALAPLNGQAINLRSNFENIDDQKLNIVLGAGAAAYNAAVGSTGAATVANQHVGGGNSVALTVNNTAPAGVHTEVLNASFGANAGQATNNGASITGGLGTGGIAGGSADNTTMRVGVDTTTAGAKSGTVTLNYVTNGLGTSGLTPASAGSPQVVNVNGNVYRFAQPNAIGPIDFGNVLAGTTQQRMVTISNLAAADGFSEALNAAFGSIGGANASSYSTSGAINGLLAGNTDNTTMMVTLNTSSTGAKTANVQILLASNGTAIGNGLGITSLPTQVINLDGVITGTVGNLASAGLSPTTVNFGKFREAQVTSQTQQLTVSNLTVGPGEGLNASFAANTGTASNNGGIISALATGASNNTSMSVTLNGLATAGAKNGSTTVNFQSDGTFNSGVPTALPSQTVDMSAEVYRLAQAGLPAAVNLAARRVGDAQSTGTLNIANTAAADGFSEGLKGTIGAAPAGFAVTGPATTALIAAGGSEARTVGLSTATAGNFGGIVSVALVSNGAGTSGFGDLSVGSANVAVSGKVYTPAVGQLVSPPASIDFGTVRVGTGVAAQAVTIVNAAAATALNDTLKGTLAVAGAGFTGNGASVSGLIAGGPDGTMQLGLDTSVAGVKAGSAQVMYVSQNADMSDLVLGSSTSIGLSGTVNALANPVFGKSAGAAAFSCTSGVCTLNLGSLQQNSGTADNTLNLQNLVAGPADDLLGDFDFSGFSGFGHSGFGAVDLDAGESVDGMTLSLDTSAVGVYSSSFFFNGFSHNPFQADWGLGPIRFNVIANVFAPGGNVPEPSTLWLLLAAAAGWNLRRRGAAA